MGTVLPHPFLFLNRYKQNDKTASIICYQSYAYIFTSKSEKMYENTAINDTVPQRAIVVIRSFFLSFYHTRKSTSLIAAIEGGNKLA